MKANDDIGEKIKTLRGKLMMTQEELASKLHVAPQTVNRWEQGKAKPSFLSLNALQKFFDKKGEKLD